MTRKLIFSILIFFNPNWFRWFKLTAQIRAWELMHGKEKDVLTFLPQRACCQLCSKIWATNSQKAIFLSCCAAGSKQVMVVTLALTHWVQVLWMPLTMSVKKATAGEIGLLGQQLQGHLGWLLLGSLLSRIQSKIANSLCQNTPVDFVNLWHYCIWPNKCFSQGWNSPWNGFA